MSDFLGGNRLARCESQLLATLLNLATASPECSSLTACTGVDEPFRSGIAP
jgi:hypothetical protein